MKGRETSVQRILGVRGKQSLLSGKNVNRVILPDCFIVQMNIVVENCNAAAERAGVRLLDIVPIRFEHDVTRLPALGGRNSRSVT